MGLCLVDLDKDCYLEGDCEIIETFDDSTRNKDVIKALYPDAEFEEIFGIPELTSITCLIEDNPITVTTEWLNDYYVYKED